MPSLYTLTVLKMSFLAKLCSGGTRQTTVFHFRRARSLRIWPEVVAGLCFWVDSWYKTVLPPESLCSPYSCRVPTSVQNLLMRHFFSLYYIQRGSLVSFFSKHVLDQQTHVDFCIPLIFLQARSTFCM